MVPTCQLGGSWPGLKMNALSVSMRQLLGTEYDGQSRLMFLLRSLASVLAVDIHYQLLDDFVVCLCSIPVLFYSLLASNCGSGIEKMVVLPQTRRQLFPPARRADGFNVFSLDQLCTADQLVHSLCGLAVV